jgi:hypothetical protein
MMKSDLSILEDFGADLAPAHDHPPAAVRHRVMHGMRQPVCRPRLLPGLTGVRLAWRLGVPAVAAAAVAAALVAAQLPGNTGRPAPPGTGVVARPGAVPQAPDAGQVLRLAAQHSADTPAMDARPNQFLYIDSVEVESRTALDKDRRGEIVPGTTTVSGPLRTRTWLSVDGTRDGLVLQGPARTHIDGCKNGRQAQTIDRPGTTPKVACVPEPAYQPGHVPTDPVRLLAHVYAIAAAEPMWVSVGQGLHKMPRGFVRLSDDQRAFAEIAEILYKNHLPAVQEAAFRAVGQIAGVQVRGNVADAAGRTGVAVTRTEAGTREELVFDPTSYQYLGHNIIGAEFDLSGATVVSAPDSGTGTSQIWSGPNPKPGEIVYKSALLRIAIVDKTRQRPSRV